MTTGFFFKKVFMSDFIRILATFIVVFFVTYITSDPITEENQTYNLYITYKCTKLFYSH